MEIKVIKGLLSVLSVGGAGLLLMACQTSREALAQTVSVSEDVTRTRKFKALPGPNPNLARPVSISLAAAKKSGDSQRIFNALTDALHSDPTRLDLRAEQAKLLAKMGKTGAAKESLEEVLWPAPGVETSLSRDLGLIETYLELAEATKDRGGMEKAVRLADEAVSSTAGPKPGKLITKPNEVYAFIAYAAHRDARNREDLSRARRLIDRAVAKDGTVALYRVNQARVYYDQGNLAIDWGHLATAVSAWKAGYAAIQEAGRSPLRTADDDAQIDYLRYLLKCQIDMANGGFYKGIEKTARGPRYTISR